MSQPALSVVIGTYNRAQLLPAALRALARQRTTVPHEVIVVDNNSGDATPKVVEAFGSAFDVPLRYEFEGRQGVSHARNTGVAAARAGLVAFTDDDNEVAPNWISAIADVVRRHAHVDCFGGKVLPRWTTPPPAWLDRAHWAPLALTDFGDEPFIVSAARPQCLITANLIVRREVFERVGGFAPEFRRAQDHEWLLRFWRSGGLGLYHPGIVVWSGVDPARMTAGYYRRWYFEHGRYAARMRLRELIDANGRLYQGEPPSVPRLLGSPRFLYRLLLEESLATLRTTWGGTRSQAMAHMHEAFDLLGCIRESASLPVRGHRSTGSRPGAPMPADARAVLSSPD